MADGSKKGKKNASAEELLVQLWDSMGNQPKKKRKASFIDFERDSTNCRKVYYSLPRLNRTKKNFSGCSTSLGMEQDCSKSSRKDTKYRCIDCNIPICNVCSVACSTETAGYSEESYCIGKCNKCQSLSNISETKPRLPDSSNVCRVKQSRDLTSYFRKVESRARSTEKASTKPSTSGKDKCKSVGSNISFTSTSHSTEKARALSVTTANRWNSTSLAKYQASTWLEINDVQSLNCSVCRAYAVNLKGMKNFSTVWAFTGSTNLRHSNAEGHARGIPRKKGMNLHLKDQGKLSMKQTKD